MGTRHTGREGGGSPGAAGEKDKPITTTAATKAPAAPFSTAAAVWKLLLGSLL